MDRIEPRSRGVYHSLQENANIPIFNVPYDIFHHHIAKYLTAEDKTSFAATCRLAYSNVLSVACHKQVSLIRNFIHLFAENLDNERFKNEINSLLKLSDSVTVDLLHRNPITKKENTYPETKDIILKIRKFFLKNFSEILQDKIESETLIRKGLTREELMLLRVQIIFNSSNPDFASEESQNKLSLFKQRLPKFFEAILAILIKGYFKDIAEVFSDVFSESCSLDEIIEIFNTEIEDVAIRDKIFLQIVNYLIIYYLDVDPSSLSWENKMLLLEAEVNFKDEDNVLNCTLKVLVIIAKVAMQLSPLAYKEVIEDYSFYWNRICDSNLIFEVIDYIKDEVIINALPSDVDTGLREHLLALCAHARVLKAEGEFEYEPSEPGSLEIRIQAQGEEFYTF